MSEEIMNAAIMRLRSRALEHYGIIKDLYRRPAAEGTTDEIVKNAITLVQFEGAMLTLQQYVPTILAEIKAEVKAEQEKEKQKAQEKEEADSKEIRGEELAKRSSSYRRSRKGKKKDEPETT